MKTLIKRELTRPPEGKYPGVIYDWDIQEKTSTNGSPYNVFLLYIKIRVNAQLMDVTYTIPLYWNIGDPMYVFCTIFGVLPELDGDFNGNDLIGKHIIVTIRENTYKERTYSNVVLAEPLRVVLPAQLVEWMNHRESVRSASDSLFEEDDALENSMLDTSLITEPSDPTKETEDPVAKIKPPFNPSYPGRRNRIFPKKVPVHDQSISTL